jgi:hypothetical protein
VVTLFSHVLHRNDLDRAKMHRSSDKNFRNKNESFDIEADAPPAVRAHFLNTLVNDRALWGQRSRTLGTSRAAMHHLYAARSVMMSASQHNSAGVLQ